MTKDVADGQERPAAGRWMRGLLIASLSINLAVAGVALGGWITHRGQGPWDGPPGGRAQFRIFGPTGVGIYAHGLTEERRRALAEDLTSHRRALFEGRRALRAHLGRVAALLRADPLDKAALEAEFAQQQERVKEQFALGQGALLRVIEKMDPEERWAFAEELERRAHPPEGPRR